MEVSMKAARINAGFTQESAAQMLNISKTTLSSYENYKTIPDVRVSEKMAQLYRLPVGSIIFYKKETL